MAIPGPGNRPTSKRRKDDPLAEIKRRYQTAEEQPESTEPERKKAPKLNLLEIKVERFYRMVGTALKPFGRFYPFMAPLGTNISAMSNEAAQAWIELAEEDRRVRSYLESITGASTWGNVIGVHFAIVASAIPGNAFLGAMQEGAEMDRSQVDEAIKSMGYSDEDIARARAYMEQQQANQQGGGPGDTMAVPQPPQYQPSPEPVVATAAPPVQQSAVRPGIVSPAELGVQNPGDQSGIFPADASPPNGSGGGGGI